MQNLRITNKRLLDRPRPQNSEWQCSILVVFSRQPCSEEHLLLTLFVASGQLPMLAGGPDEQRAVQDQDRGPGRHILSRVYAALYAPMRSTYTVTSSCRKGVLGRPLLQLRSMLQLSPWVQWLSRTARCLQLKRSMPLRDSQRKRELRLVQS